MKHAGRDISEFPLAQLQAILNSMQDAEAKRVEASKHEKFKKMLFPPTNPEFLNLKIAIEEEIRKRENANPTV